MLSQVSRSQQVLGVSAVESVKTDTPGHAMAQGITDIICTESTSCQK